VVAPQSLRVAIQSKIGRKDRITISVMPRQHPHFPRHAGPWRYISLLGRNPTASFDARKPAFAQVSFAGKPGA
jgi:hypothetical protein